MIVKKKKSHINQKCCECGLGSWPEVIEIKPERSSKVWRFCKVCFDRIFIKRALRSMT